MTPLRSFASVDRFLAELSTPRRRPGYILAGDETFLYERCRQGVLAALVPPGLRDFCLHDLDLADTSIFEALGRAQTPSLLAPFQVFFLRNLKTLYTRGGKKEEFAAIDAYFRSPNPDALLLFVADHLHLPTDLRRIDFQEKERFERIRESLGDHCGSVELARVDEADAIRWITEESALRHTRIDPDAARELADALGADMMLISSELEKLLLYVTAPGVRAPHLREDLTLAEMGGLSASRLDQDPNPSRLQGEPLYPTNSTPLLFRITLGDVETMVLAAKQRSLYELTDAISLRDRPRALALLHGLLNSSDGGEDAAIGHLYMLARTFRQMLIIVEKNVRDSRAIWQVLWQGFRMPPFAADDLIRQARRYKSRRDLTRSLRLIARADLELRSSPANKLLVLERLMLALAADHQSISTRSSPQFAIEL